MGNYDQLKQSVSDVIKTNGNQEITGSILQNVLLTIISTVGANATFAGIATPATNPGTPDGPVFYLASESGTYSNFGSIELQDGLSVLMWNGSWSSQQIFGVDDVPTAGSDNLVKSGGIAQAIHTILTQKRTETSTVISKTDGSIGHNYPWEFFVAYYDVSELSGCVKIKTTRINPDVSLYSLMDADNNVIAFSDKGTDVISEAFINVTNGTTLCVQFGNQTSCSVEYFNNDAITELFDRTKEIREDFDEFSNNIVNYESLDIDISQYILWDKRIATEGSEVEGTNYAYVKLPISLFTVGEKYYFKGKSAQYVPGVIILREGGSNLVVYGDSVQYTIQATDTYVCINLNVVNNLALARSICDISEINKEVYSKSQTNNEIDSHIESIVEGSEYNIVEDNCEFYINKRYTNYTNVPIQPPIDADGYVCAKFTNIDITKIYAADCISSQYVPGYMLLDENDIIISQGNPFTYQVYNKEVLPIKDNSYKTIILQAKVDTSNLNDVTVKGVLRLFVKKPLKNAYSAGEIDDKLYQRDVKIKDLEINQQSEEEYKKNQNYWIGKSIAWFGTSIPEGGVWVGGPTYPHKVGRMLGVSSTHNEAVGGSCAANVISGYTTFQYWYIRMGHSVAQNIDLFRDAYTVDYTNQTVSDGPRTMIADLHLSSLPTVTTYSNAVDLLADMVGCSYEIKLVYRYLISDETESENYLNRIFAGYSNELNALKNISQASVYKNILKRYDIDLIVFDHGHNDNPTPVENADFYDDNTNGIDTTGMSTWLGAMNTYMRLIMFYKPKMRIAQISDYYYGNTVKSQEQFARRWQIPYCEVWKSLPYLYNRFKVTVRGYWDANGIWHDKGFTWTEPTNMSDTNISNYTNLVANAYELESGGGYAKGTIGALKTNINPRQENGEWVWETNLSNIFMKDGLHPGSDYTWKCVDLYARALVQFIKGI